MISRNRIKFILSLQKKKIRDEKRYYVIEGDKLVKEYLLSRTGLHLLVAKPEFTALLLPEEKSMIDEIELVSYDELRKLSTLKTPHSAIAVVPFPEYRTDQDKILESLCAVLDTVQDPGNLGTIIRAAAWFGIKDIVCSENCVDVYNPKVIQSTMGAVLNTKVHYTNIKKFIGAALKRRLPVYGAVLEGESIYTHKLSNKGVIILGNESKGISDELMPFITTKLSIPKFTSSSFGIESLNVGMAASIVFSEFARRNKNP